MKDQNTREVLILSNKLTVDVFTNLINIVVSLLFENWWTKGFASVDASSVVIQVKI